MRILPQWEMEFDVGKLEDYRRVMDTAQGSGLPVQAVLLVLWPKHCQQQRGAMYCVCPPGFRGNTFGIWL